MTRYWDHSGSIYKDDGQEDWCDPITEQQALAEITEQQEQHNERVKSKIKELRARMKSVGAQTRQATEQPYPTFTEQSAAYREGAQAYNEGKSWRDNPHAPESGLAAPWRMGFNTRKQQVAEIRAQRAAAARQEN
ncbi:MULTISPECIES: hypothetical protein [Corynebacterium]|uniref:hypothetical protein n=1 Tax=Corynebacterium TaxID=1716 RepID=UPI000665D611|nr:MULTISPECIES: hypothetical protein [Corynebacterium]MCG7269641.1 hypothetical protein [Corynebacterium amycolatum]MDC7116370.1 hypothetical protein [Corynebacterium amycolatum]MDK8727238.1 hypothetical protein [Corynebacterium amycolatum]OFO26314.1 hypothetical protein HMPREF3053_10325 [Corynebacterium sp. HMSC064E07]OHR38560.1 hypothetical protein HMPREF2920_03340 [Corynebacterium sp. HMSC075F02]